MKSSRYDQTHTLDASFTTTPVNCSDANDLGVQINVTTNANTGVFIPQCSNDADPTASGAVWDDIALDTPIAALAGANTKITVSLVDLPFLWFRMKFTIGTGTNGSADIKIFSKEV